MTDEGRQTEARLLIDELPQDVREALEAIDEHKGLDIVVLDMRQASGFTDFMILCTGRSEPHAQALAKAVEERLLEHKVKPSHVEGKSVGRWILLDYLQLIVHVFVPETRTFYQLEKLWRDAPLLEWGVPADAAKDADEPEDAAGGADG